MNPWKPVLLVAGYLLMAVPLTISKDTRRSTPWVDYTALGGVLVFVAGAAVKRSKPD